MTKIQSVDNKLNVIHSIKHMFTQRELEYKSNIEVFNKLGRTNTEVLNTYLK
jgi:hypothetical protein